MPIEQAASDGPPLAIHATVVAIGERGLVIRGPSRAGKSTLALALIAASRPDRPIVLVGDDRVLLSRIGADVFAAPHPRIAGLIEKRGDGILAMPHRGTVAIAAVVDLPPADRDPPADTPACGAATTCDLAGKNFPSLSFVKGRRWDARCACVLAWLSATSAAQCGQKQRWQPTPTLKD